MIKDKRTLRKEIRQQLAELPETHFTENSKIISNKLVEWLNMHPGVTKVALYSALPSEVNLKAVTVHLPKIEWHYPVVNRTEMTFHRVSNPSSLQQGFCDILEPDPMVHPAILSSDLDLILCPGLSFTKTGSRLGRGGGFYDRFLSTISGTPIMGVCLEEQLSNALPCETHDILMTHLITPTGYLTTKKNTPNIA